MTPNTRKPTKKQVPDYAKCWVGYYNSGGSYWWLKTGRVARGIWVDGEDRWLPYAAIPDPNNTQQSPGEPT